MEISFEDLANKIQQVGALSKFPKQGKDLQLEQQCYNQLLTQLMEHDTEGRDTTLPLIQLELLKILPHENVKNFHSKAEWQKEMRRRMKLIKDEDWDALHPISLLDNMIKHYQNSCLVRGAQTEQQSTSVNKQATTLLKNGYVGRSAEAYERGLKPSTFVNTSNDPHCMEKTTLLFPEVELEDYNPSPALLHDLHQALTEALDKHLTPTAFINQVRKAKLLKMVGADRWNIDLLKPLFYSRADGLHDKLAPLFVGYIKMILTNRVPPAYVQHMVLRRLVFTLAKDKIHTNPALGKQLRPIQPYSALFKIAEQILQAAHDTELLEYFHILQLGVRQRNGTSIVVQRLQEGYNKQQTLTTGDETNGYGQVTLRKAAQRVQQPALQALAHAQAAFTSCLYTVDGQLVSNNSNTLPQGGVLSGNFYSQSRHEGVVHTNSVITGGAKVTDQGAMCYIDNIYTHHPLAETAVAGYIAFERYIQAEGSCLNAKDATVVVPLTEESTARDLLHNLPPESTLKPGCFKFHPDQQGVTGTPIEQHGLVAMGVPVGSTEFQTKFMTTKVATLIEANYTLLKAIANKNVQHFLLIFRQCKWHHQIGYWGRLIHPTIMEPLIANYQQEMFKLLESVFGPLSEFHRRWMGLVPEQGGINLFDLNMFNLAGYIACSIEFEAYKHKCLDTYNPVCSTSLKLQMERYIIEIGGLTAIPTKWSTDGLPPSSVDALFQILVDLRLADTSKPLQRRLHKLLRLQQITTCAAMLPTQPIPVQAIYCETRAAGANGVAAILTIPKTPNTTFTPTQMQLIVRKQFGLPLLGLNSGQETCPGCHTPLDVHGSHLANCRSTSTKGEANAFSHHLLHNQLGEELIKILRQKFNAVQANPKGLGNRPTLADGTLGRLDIGYTPRDTGPIVLCDLSISNPLTAQVMNSAIAPTRSTALENIRINKNNTYLIPIQALADRKLLIFPFHMYGAVGDEVTAILQEVASHVHPDDEQLESLLFRKYKREIACALHKGVARYYEARLELCKARSTHSQPHWQTVTGHTNFVIEELNEDQRGRAV